MKNLFYLFFLLISIGIFSSTSCKSEETEGLKLTINAPENGASFDRTDTIIISYTVTDDIDISTIAYFNRTLGTGSVRGTTLTGDNDTFYEGEFRISADVAPGTYDISLSATDEGITNVVEEILTVNIQ